MKKIFICFLALMLTGCSVISVQETETGIPVSGYDSDISTQAEPVVTEEPEISEGISMFDTLSSEEKKKLNVFFSNFAEASLDEYNCDNISVNDLILFAFIHNRVNGTSPEEYDMFESSYFGSVMGIRTEVMDEIINRYLGIRIPHNDAVYKNEYGGYSGWAFKDGYVYTEAASGESYDYCAVATSFTDLKDGTYLAEYDVYSAGYDMMSSKYYSYTPEQAQNDPNLEYCSSYIAIIKPAVVNGNKTWHLLKLKTA